MNEPYRSILDQEFDDLYLYVSSVGRSHWGVSETGRMAALLAYHTGSGISTAIIVGAYPEVISEIDWSYEQLIVELIAEYSELSLCSGWNDGIEYELWAVLNNDLIAEGPVRMSWPSEGVKQSILKVAKHAEKWALWSESQGKPVAINLSNWLGLYSQWRKSANKSV